MACIFTPPPSAVPPPLLSLFPLRSSLGGDQGDVLPSSPPPLPPTPPTPLSSAEGPFPRCCPHSLSLLFLCFFTQFSRRPRGCFAIFPPTPPTKLPPPSSFLSLLFRPQLVRLLLFAKFLCKIIVFPFSLAKVSLQHFLLSERLLAIAPSEFPLTFRPLQSFSASISCCFSERFQL